jgi:hypothetical protein
MTQANGVSDAISRAFGSAGPVPGFAPTRREADRGARFPWKGPAPVGAGRVRGNRWWLRRPLPVSARRALLHAPAQGGRPSEETWS